MEARGMAQFCENFGETHQFFHLLNQLRIHYSEFSRGTGTEKRRHLLKAQGAWLELGQLLES